MNYIKFSKLLPVLRIYVQIQSKYYSKDLYSIIHNLNPNLNPNQCTNLNCDKCLQFIKRGASKTGGIGVAICRTDYTLDQTQNVAVLLPKEKYGIYADQYNVCGGKRENPSECFIQAASRELVEEICVDFNPDKLVIIDNRPVIVIFDNELSVSVINANIDKQNNNSSLPDHYKEIYRCDWFDINKKVMIESNVKYKISSYALKLINALSDYKFSN